MSKISLEPNDSGAGTFSIVSPDSNTNRTLNLPDEAGTILSDASTIDSNNLQSDVYKQSNILGTVSESGGVPTGAIMERGSNDNGEFVKFADGTMICLGVTPQGTGSTKSYPAAFVSTPFHPPGNNNNARNVIARYGLFGSSNSTSFTVRWDRDDTFANYIAIGRWY